MKALTLADILSKDDLPLRSVEVPQWDGCVHVRTMRADERSHLEKQFTKRKPSDDPGGFRRALLKATLCLKDGTPMLPDDATADALMQKNAEAVEVIFEAACEQNGFRQKDVETLEKN